jgi:D-xylose transport system permease protein
MATGMVLVIVTRNIDLSVGSMLGFVGMVTGLVQARLLPASSASSTPAIWVLSILAAASCVAG